MRANNRWSWGEVTVAIGCLLLWASGPAVAVAGAQTRTSAPTEVSVGAGWGALWDDETNLGRGAPLSGGVGRVIGGRLRLGGDVDWTSHVRDSGYLRAEGNLVGLFARASYLFGGRDAAVRPLGGGGVGWLRSSGTLVTSSLVLGPTGMPVDGPQLRQPWSATRPALELHGGVRVRLTDRVTLRPEGRWRATFGRAASSSIELPLIGIQGLVHVDVGL